MNVQEKDPGSDGWTWKPDVKTYLLLLVLFLSLLPFLLRWCGVKPTRTQLPPVNAGFNSEEEARNANNSARQIANLMEQFNQHRQNTSVKPVNSGSKATP